MITRRPVVPFAKRRAVDILTDVLSRLQGGDRQMWVLSIQFGVEHFFFLHEYWDIPTYEPGEANKAKGQEI